MQTALLEGWHNHVLASGAAVVICLMTRAMTCSSVHKHIIPSSFNYQHPIFITAAVIHTLDKHNTNTQCLYKANKILYSMYQYTSSTHTQAIETAPWTNYIPSNPLYIKPCKFLCPPCHQLSMYYIGRPTRHVHTCVPLASLQHAYAQCTQHDT